MFTDTAAKDDHARFSSLEGDIIQKPYIAYDIYDQAGRAVRVKVDHITQRAVCERRTENWDIVLRWNQQEAL